MIYKKSKIKYLKVFIFLFFIFIASLSYAEEKSKEVLDQKISDTQRQIDALDREIAQYQNKINKTAEEANTLANLIKELSLAREKLQKEQNQTEKKIDVTKQKLSTLNTHIEEKNKEINISREALRKSLYDIYQNDNNSIVEVLLKDNGIINASMEYQHRVSLNSRLGNFIDETLELKKDLEISHKEKQLENTNLNSLKNKLAAEKKAVEIAKKEKDKILKETKNKESEYKKLLAERQKMREEFDKELRAYESELKFLLDRKLLPKGAGSLQWPLKNIFITQMFGRTASSGRLYASGSHSGVDFRASIGTPVYAMGKGTVLGTGDTDIYCKGASFGKWVFIKYENGLSSTFGHLSSIIAQKGQEVDADTIIALSGNTGHSTGPHLHVSVYATQGADIREFPSKSCKGAHFVMPVAPVEAYLDPLKYLPVYTSDMVKK